MSQNYSEDGDSSWHLNNTIFLLLQNKRRKIVARQRGEWQPLKCLPWKDNELIKVKHCKIQKLPFAFLILFLKSGLWVNLLKKRISSIIFRKVELSFLEWLYEISVLTHLIALVKNKAEMRQKTIEYVWKFVYKLFLTYVLKLIHMICKL